MTLAYTSSTTFVGYYEYARRESDGQWFSRFYGVTRNHTFRRPDHWREWNPAVEWLAIADPPCQKFTHDGRWYHRVRGVSYKLPERGKERL